MLHDVMKLQAIVTMLHIANNHAMRYVSWKLNRIDPVISEILKYR